MLLIVNTAAVLFMAGVGWLVQTVVYPIFALVGDDGFADFHAEWSRRITTVVIVPMTVDLSTSIWLAIAPPQDVGQGLPAAGALLAGVTWISTALLQVPRHQALSAGFDSRAHAALVRSSWVRTAAWSAHAAVCVAMLLLADGGT